MHEFNAFQFHHTLTKSPSSSSSPMLARSSPQLVQQPRQLHVVQEEEYDDGDGDDPGWRPSTTENSINNNNLQKQEIIRKPSPIIFSHHHHQHQDLLRTDSGNSSLNTIDTFSTDSGSNSGSGSSNHSDYGFGYDGHLGVVAGEDDTILINVFVPETQSEFDITCSYNQTIWYVKTVLVEQCFNNRPGLHDQKLNYGFFSNQYGHFVDEQLTFFEYLTGNNNDTTTTTNNNYVSGPSSTQIDPHHHHHQQQQNHQHNNYHHRKQQISRVVKLEFLYKQRVKYGEIMSTLPLASATRKKRKRSRLLTAIQNGNLDKLAKALVNCDPNFVDESTGETPLSLASGQPSSNTTTAAATTQQQQIIVAIVNGGALLDFRTKDGRTALHAAVQKSNFIALKTLLDLGASPNYLDSNGLTPLYYSVIYKANPKLTQLLLYEHATIGITDQHGWQEVHHASKLGLVQHLEQLLYYGCDMNSRIVGSGNTSLHVAAINDQVECARTLLLRGCDTVIVNNSHQNAYQVAVIAGNMSLADYIKNHQPEQVVPYRDKPRFNPARRPQNSCSATGAKDTPTNKNDGRSRHHLAPDMNGAGAGQDVPRSISPSWSQMTNNTTTTSSGVCCEDEDDPSRLKQRTVMNNGTAAAADTTATTKKTADDYENQHHGDDDNDDDNHVEDGDEDDEDEEDGQNWLMMSSESEDSTAFAAGMMVKAISDYNSGDPSHMQIRRNDHVVLLHSDHSPPTIASQKFLLGRRCLDGKEGYFPACCVEKIKPIKDTTDSNTDHRVEGRRDLKMKNMLSATLPTRGRRGARKSYLDKNITRQYQDRTVTLHKGSKGFGFVLRGAKDSSPILTKQLMQQVGGSVPLIGLQYFDEIEAGGVADAAGLKRGDFLLAVNDIDVRHMSHENVVQLIRQSGDKVTMTIATPVPKQLVSILKKKGSNLNGTSTSTSGGGDKQQQPLQALQPLQPQPPPPPPPLASTSSQQQQSSKMDNKTTTNGGTEPQMSMSTSQSQLQMSQSVYASFTTNRVAKAPPPAPPKRDPSTTLSTSRARARSLVVASEVRSAHTKSLMLLNEIKTSVDETLKMDGDNTSVRKSPESSSVVGRSSRRISSYEPSEFGSCAGDPKPNINAPPTLDGSKPNGTANTNKRDSCTMSPPTSPAHHSIVNVTLAKVPLATKNGESKAAESNGAATAATLTTANRPLSSFIPNSNNINPSDNEPLIPEPDYSSDEDPDQNNKNKKNPNSSNDNSSRMEKVKFTTKATVVLKSTSPLPPEPPPIGSTLNDPMMVAPPIKPEIRNGIGLGPSKNIFEELKEQSAKITSAARLRFAVTADGDGSNSIVQQQTPMVGRGDSGAGSKVPNNVKKNVAEFEKRLNGTSGLGSIKDQNDTQLRMSKSCLEEFVQPPPPPNMLSAKKEILKTTMRPKPTDQTTNNDFQRNSAIISAMAEKVAAVNQLVAEHQHQHQSGSKSLNSSPVPLSLGKMTNASIVVQKPIAMLPGGGGTGVGGGAMGGSNLTRRCVTVCEDPVKTVHLQQQHHHHQQQQQLLRSQLMAAQAMAAGGGTLTKSSKQQQQHHSSSLSETNPSILKQQSSGMATSKSHSRTSSTTGPTGTMDVVPPPPEFAASLPQQQQQAQQAAMARQAMASGASAATNQHQQLQQQQQKIYMQRQMQQQQQQTSTSPMTIPGAMNIAGAASSGSSGQQQLYHHGQQHSQQLISGEMPPQHYSHQATHYHLHHNHPNQAASASASASLSSSAPTTNTDSHVLMRQSILAAQQQQQQNAASAAASSTYDYLAQQRATNPLISHHHHHQLMRDTSAGSGSGGGGGGQQIYVQQGQQPTTANQLLFQQQQQQRALAAAKLYQQQQQQQHQLNRSGGQYNTLASSKPLGQQSGGNLIQYYIQSQQQQNPSQPQQHSHVQNPQQQSQQQYFATLSRHAQHAQHAQQQQQYLTSLTSQQQQQMQQQQFATLTRHHQQQLMQPHQSTGNVQQANLINYIQRQQPQPQQQQLGGVAGGGGRVIQAQPSMVNRQQQAQQQPTTTTATTTNKMVNPYSVQYQQQQYQAQAQAQAQQQQQPQQPAVAYARKSVVEWTPDDCQEWLQRIGMAEHRLKFESFNGAKMLRLDNNSLVTIGVRQQQHRIYILEKLKQQIWQNHQ